MILQGVGHPISCIGVCYANDPKKGGYMTPAPALDLTTSLRGDSCPVLLPSPRILFSQDQAHPQVHTLYPELTSTGQQVIQKTWHWTPIIQHGNRLALMEQPHHTQHIHLRMAPPPCTTFSAIAVLSRLCPGWHNSQTQVFNIARAYIRACGGGWGSVQFTTLPALTVFTVSRSRP